MAPFHGAYQPYNTPSARFVAEMLRADERNVRRHVFCRSEDNSTSADTPDGPSVGVSFSADAVKGSVASIPALAEELIRAGCPTSPRGCRPVQHCLAAAGVDN